MAADGIRAVVFDVGEVLYRWRPADIYAGHIGDEAARDRFVADVVSMDWHDQHDIGRPFAETSAELSARFPEHADLIALWGPNFNASLSPMPGMAALVDELDAAGVPLYAITNFSGEFWAAFVATQGHVFDRFRGIVVSGDEKLMKPDPAIYRLALDRFGLDPAEAIFVDDRAANVAGAQAAGMAAHRFTGADDFRARLVRDGLLPAARAAA